MQPERTQRPLRTRIALAGALLAASCCALAPAVALASPERLARKLGDRFAGAGGASGAIAVDLDTHKTLFADDADVRRIPASVEKLYTTSTALVRFGAHHRFATRILGRGHLDEGGTWHGNLYLRGGGDPTFGSGSFNRAAYGTGARAETLARRVRRRGIERVSGRVYGDESRFDSRRGGPESGYGVSMWVEPLSALAYNRSLADPADGVYQDDPPEFAAQRMTDELRGAGVSVAHGARAGDTPRGAKRLAVVHSPRVGTLIRLTNQPSDNFFAETLLKDLGARFRHSGTTRSGTQVVLRLAHRWDLHPRIVDGSGLSRSDATSPAQVVGVLSQMADRATFVRSLSVAGESGTLAQRMQGTRAQGRCRGKTGTLSNVSALAGYCEARNGHTIAFAMLMNDVVPSAAHGVQDAFAETIARYR